MNVQTKMNIFYMVNSFKVIERKQGSHKSIVLIENACLKCHYIFRREKISNNISKKKLWRRKTL